MALRRSLSQRFSPMTKGPSPRLTATTHFLSSKPIGISSPDSTKPNGGGGFFRRFLQKRALAQSAVSTIPMGDRLMGKLKGMNLRKDRLRLDELIPPPVEKIGEIGGISIADAKKLLRMAQLQVLKSALRRIPRSSISYSEFLAICVDNSSRDQGLEFAKMLDESGAVIVIKDTVFLRPEQVTKAIHGLIPLPAPRANDPRRRELEMMEKEKTAIDKKAETLVRRELWGGLGFLLLQTVGFVRLTFWELSWDVMEPICFYLTSIYFMASYAFFLRTSQEPCFQGFFQSRFKAKQKRVMGAHKFDLERFNELKRACYPHSWDQAASGCPKSLAFDRHQGDLTYAMNYN